MTANPTTQNPNNTDQNNGNISNNLLFWSLFIPVLLGCLGMVCALYFSRHNLDNALKNLPPIDYRYIPPELLGYRQTSISVCSLEGTPQCFAVQNDSTFIVGTAHPHALYFFDEKGTQIRRTSLPDEPKAIVCGTEKTIFTNKILIAHPNQVAIYDAQGEYEKLFKNWKLPDNYGKNSDDKISDSENDKYLWSASPFFISVAKKIDIHSLVLTPKYLFAADSGDCRIYRFQESGRDDFEFGGTHRLIQGKSDELTNHFIDRTGSDFEGFAVYASPITMTFSSQKDLLYISNPGKHRVEVFTQEGEYKPELGWGEPSGDVSGFVGCCNPIGLAVLEDERVLTVEKSASRIKIYSKDRRLDCVVAGANTLEDIPSELRRTPIPPGGRYFSAEELPDKRIVVFDFDYAILRFFEAAK